METLSTLSTVSTVSGVSDLPAGGGSQSAGMTQ
jgi:hypothetical protein